MTVAAATNSRWGSIWLAAAAGVLSLAVALGLAWNHRQLDRVNPTNHPGMAELKAQLEKNLDKPAQREPLRERIRLLDQQLRQEYFGRLRFERAGLGMLMAALAMLAITTGKVFFQAAPPMPKPTTQPPSPTPAATSRRWSLAAAVAVLVAAGGFLGALAPRTAATSASAEASPDAAPALAAAAAPGREQLLANWPSFRGIEGGVARQAKPVLTWDAPAGKNVLWKTAIPLPGHGSPVVWGERVFVSGADEKNRVLYCLDGATGAMLWQQPVQTAASVRAGPTKVMEDTGYAAPTPVTDGRFVAAIFANGDLACFAVDGRLAWSVALGPIDSRYGYAASLAFYGNLLLVQLDQADEETAASRLIALDFATGKKVWETPRPVGASWASPLVISPPGLPAQVITSASPWVISYDAASGKELWKANVLAGDVAPSPVYADGLVYVVNTEPKLSAIRPDGQGDVTATGVAWTAEDGLPDIASPLTDGKYVLLAQTSGTVTCYDAKSGKKLWDKLFDEDGFRGSPSLVDGKLLLISGGGVGIVADWSGDGYHEVARNPLGEEVSASPAFAGLRLFVRGKDHLFCIGAKP